jgi:hypothetical protein
MALFERRAGSTSPTRLTALALFLEGITEPSGGCHRNPADLRQPGFAAGK